MLNKALSPCYMLNMGYPLDIFVSVIIFIISLPEPKAHRYAYRIPMVRPSSAVVHNAQTSSQKPLGRSKQNFIWSLLGMGKRKFVRDIWVI